MIYFTADTHFGCTKLVAHSRPTFSSVEEHDAALIDAINAQVGRDDRLMIIGDFCKEKPGRYRPKIRCKNLMFIVGNHDQESKIRAVFGGNVRHSYMCKCSEGRRVFCAHYPHAFWDRSHYGVYHAYGHIHHKPRFERMLDSGFPERRSMDVGVDHAHKVLGAYRPFSEEEFFALLRTRTGHDFVLPEEKWHDRDYDLHCD